MALPPAVLPLVKNHTKNSTKYAYKKKSNHVLGLSKIKGAYCLLSSVTRAEVAKGEYSSSNGKDDVYRQLNRKIKDIHSGAICRIESLIRYYIPGGVCPKAVSLFIFLLVVLSYFMIFLVLRFVGLFIFLMGFE
jgi:hypothetical protein